MADILYDIESNKKINSKFGMVSRIGKYSCEKYNILKHRQDIIDNKGKRIHITAFKAPEISTNIFSKMKEHHYFKNNSLNIQNCC